ncbi:DUF6527 family protein [Flavobacterium johnsoniae]|uniref:Uncharacterized protein n=1 Tax=Flavobacterium johnsoniae TaxID=986 RepID=A0A1M5IG75_FLAJO|nr:DUF6527 family protein [Flavobacterium johnsoniae]SHG27318.1 hypothetical protein SAMN05444388_10288 [Flavobacterium johnsoniae]
MKTLKKVNIEPVFVESIPEELEENKIYISDKYKTASHLCLCGCKTKTITPLSGGVFWDLIKHTDGKITLIGSVGNYSFPCKSHYVINNNVANFI